MLQVAADFPHSGSFAYIDDVDAQGNGIVEKVRILRDNNDGWATVSFLSRRYPSEIASRVTRVAFADLRETEQAAPISPPKPSGRTKGRRR